MLKQWQGIRADILEAKDSIEDWNDCAIKALAMVSGLNYGLVRKVLAKTGRKPGQGTAVSKIMVALKYCQAYNTGDYQRVAFTYRGDYDGFVWRKPSRNVNIRTFAAICNQEKSYLVISGYGKYAAGCHITAVVNGVVADHTSLSSAKVSAYLEFETMPMAAAFDGCTICGEPICQYASCDNEKRKLKNRNRAAKSRSKWDMTKDDVCYSTQPAALKYEDSAIAQRLYTLATKVYYRNCTK